MAQERSGWVLPGLLVGGFLAGWGLLHLFPGLRTILFLTFLSVVLATMIERPITLLARWLPRLVATLTVVAGLIAIGAGVIWLVAPPFIEQVRVLVSRIPAAVERIQYWWQAVSDVPMLSQANTQEVVSRLRGLAGTLAMGVIPAAVGTVSFVAHGLAAVVLALFFAHQPQEYLRGLLALVPRDREEAIMVTTAAMVQALRGWTLGTLVAMTTVAAMTAIGLLIIGVDLWFALTVIAFVGQFIPFLGPVLSAVPAIAVGLVESPAKALQVALVYLVVQQVEGNLLQPLVMRWAVRIRPGLLMVWQLAMTTAFGLAGLIIATPLLAALQVAVRKGYVERVLGKPPDQ